MNFSYFHFFRNFGLRTLGLLQADNVGFLVVEELESVFLYPSSHSVHVPSGHLEVPGLILALCLRIIGKVGVLGKGSIYYLTVSFS